METTKEKIRSVLEQFSITQYQAERIADMILDYTQSNSLLEVSIPEQCPKCGIYRPEVVKNGKTGSGKQMYKCKCCGKRFTATSGHLMENSHFGKDKWRSIIIDTICGYSIRSTAKSLLISMPTVFKMRHKVLRFLEESTQDTMLKGFVEADETFLKLNGKRRIGELERGIRESSKQAGTGKMACVACVVEPGGAAFCRSYNWGAIGSADTDRILSHVSTGSTLVVDGWKTYKASSERNSLNRIAVDGKDGTGETNLKAVNSFHQQIKQLIRYYRGISVKYINRYCALFSMRWTIKVKDSAEILSWIKELIWNFRMKTTLKQVLNENLWNPLAS